MAVGTYTIKRGNNLWSLAAGKYGAEYASAIPGNTTSAKVANLGKINNIANTSLVYPNQVIYLNEAAKSGSSSSSSSSSTTPKKPANSVDFTAFGLQSESSSGRDVFASWTWDGHSSDKDPKHFDKFKIRWEWDSPNPSNPKKPITRVQEAETTDKWATFTIPKDFQKTANWVQIFVTPIAKFKTNSKGETTDTPYWKANEYGQKYNFSENPPAMPDTPTCEVDGTTLTMKIDSIKKETDASYIVFQVVKDNTSAVYTSDKLPLVAVTDDYYKVSHTHTVALGSNYKVRAKSVGANKKESGWTEFSEEVATKPSAPAMLSESCRRVKRTDGTQAAHLEWTAVSNATKYRVEYTNIKEDFDNGSDKVTSVTTEDDRTSIDIVFDSSDLGKDYYFRVRAINDKIQDTDNQTSAPSEAILIPIGSPPAAPSTYSSSESAFVGETMELNWIHNPTDNSKQSFAEISLKIDDRDWVSYVLENTTDVNTTGERVDEETFTYGKSVSYKGELYFKMDTNHVDLKNAKIQWKVRTAGVTDAFSDTAWSVERTIYIYEKPTLDLSMTSDLAGTGELITTLTGFPFYIRGQLSLTDYTIQKPVGYHLRIVANDYYVTVDDIGRTKTVNPGDHVYSKYFDTDSTLIVEMSANNVDFTSSINYTVYCDVDMSTGLTVSNTHDFTVNWVDTEYAINADVSVNEDAYTALISPSCREMVPITVGEGDDAYTTYEDGDLITNVTLSVYRREYDGSYTEVASGIPNDGTSVTDPHPALDYARYRFVAKDTDTGAISYWDRPGLPVKCSAIIIQWDEVWSTFDVGESTMPEGPSWSGSLLKLPYNVKVTDKRKRDVTFMEYAGREHPVSYYGTQIDESSTWSTEIPADDKETIYALRRLSLWSGNAYVREPSGMGYWANVEVSFNKSYDDVKISVSLGITRVEGGV